MKKALFIILTIIILAGAGAAVYFFWWQNDSNQTNTNASGTSEEEQQTSGFNALATQGEPFVATITTTQNGEINEATISFDGQGTSEYVTTAGGQTSRTVYTSEAFYTCNDAQGCFKFDLSESSGTNIDPNQYQFEASDIEDYGATANNEGQKPCGDATCDVWVSNSFQNQGKTTIYVDSNSKRIMKVESQYDGVKSSITYEYKDVTIKVPKNAQELPAGI